LGAHFPGNRDNGHFVLIIDIAHGLGVSVREGLHCGKEAVVNVLVRQRIEKLLERPLVGWLDWAEEEIFVWRKNLVSLPLARVEGFIDGRQDLVRVYVVEALGLSQ